MNLRTWAITEIRSKTLILKTVPTKQREIQSSTKALRSVGSSDTRSFCLEFYNRHPTTGTKIIGIFSVVTNERNSEKNAVVRPVSRWQHARTHTHRLTHTQWWYQMLCGQTAYFPLLSSLFPVLVCQSISAFQSRMSDMFCRDILCLAVIAKKKM